MADDNANTSDEVAKCFQQVARDYQSEVIVLKCLLQEVWGLVKSANASGEPFPCECDRCKDLVRRVNAALRDIP